MEQGVTIDKAHYGMPGQSEWLEGTPEYSMWTGMKTKGKERFPVTTFRCTGCGYLESYANAATGG
jgi:hypothetical protein